jgi:hypothetical protein
MDRPNELKQSGEAQNLHIWRCAGCEAVHLKAGTVLLNFTKADFAELAYSVNDLFQTEFGSLEFYHLISSLEGRAEIFSTGTIS